MSKSPCIDICKIDKKTGYCIGCFRTKDEIKDWRKLKDGKRQRIIDKAPERRKQLRG